MSKTLRGIKSIEDFELDGKKVFLRLDLNAPLKDGEITDDTRIAAALPTIEYAISKGAKLVIASHVGRPKTEADKKSLSIEPIARELNSRLNVESFVVEDHEGDAAKALLAGLKSNQIILMENLRFHEGETKNDLNLAQVIANYMDIYINDAFGASHREHMSVVGIPSLMENRGLGFLLKKEIEMLDHLVDGAEAPYLAILGGAKVSDKIKVIERLIDSVDGLVIGGAMAYTFLAAQKVPVGDSLVEKDFVTFAKNLAERMEGRGKKLYLPVDHRTVTGFTAVESLQVSESSAIGEGRMGIDIGPQTEAIFSDAISKAKTVFWNGPMGVFETKEYASGTFAVAKAVAESDAMSIVGGGDSAAAAKASGYAEKMSHISTGGGASLEYLQGVKLPGVEALRAAKRSEVEGEQYLNE
ncbi:MAG: phosphoglycerate kinase [Bdellovibrionales bacterium]|nr:phosphoglycerate kinase [Bdellovibrionales bacterium]